MNNISQHIVHLLNQYDCVIVPNLGGFVLRNESAVILSNKILPPQKVISFNAHLNHNDGFLASKLAQKAGVKYNVALAEINQFVDNLLITLKSDKVVEIANLGKLMLNSDAKLEFLPHEFNSFPDNFGLESLLIVPLQRKQNEITIILPARTNVFKYAAACVFLLIFWFLSPPSVHDGSVNYYSNLSPINWSEIIQEQEKEQAEQQAEELRKLLLQEQKQKAVAAKTSKKDKFHVIVAALDATSAQKYCKQLKAENHSDARVFRYKKLCRVSIASFATKSEALCRMRTLRQTSPQHSRAWVYCE